MNVSSSFNTQTANFINQNKTNTEDTLSKIGAVRELSGKDGASLIVSNALSSQISELTQNIQNQNESVAMYQIADATLRDLRQGADKLNQLSIANGNGALNDTQKSVLQEDFNKTLSAMSDAIETTSYNGKALLSSELNLEVSGLDELSIDNQEGIANFMDNLDVLNSAVGSNINKSEVIIANSLSAVSNVTSANANVSEQPLDAKINDLSSNQIKLESSILAQNHQTQVLQQRISTLLV
jgi:flagellin